MFELRVCILEVYHDVARLDWAEIGPCTTHREIWLECTDLATWVVVSQVELIYQIKYLRAYRMSDWHSLTACICAVSATSGYRSKAEYTQLRYCQYRSTAVKHGH